MKNAMKHEAESDINCNWYTWNDPKRLGKGVGLEELEIGGRAETIPTTTLLKST